MKEEKNMNMIEFRKLCDVREMEEIGIPEVIAYGWPIYIVMANVQLNHNKSMPLRHFIINRKNIIPRMQHDQYVYEFKDVMMAAYEDADDTHLIVNPVMVTGEILDSNFSERLSKYLAAIPSVK